MSSLPIFITGNPNKAALFSEKIGIKVPHAKLDIDEIQTLTSDEIVEHKARQAYSQLGKPVLVEDVSLVFEAWGGLPGPFIKFYVDSDGGSERLCRMLEGFDNKRAIGSCTFGYFDGKSLKLIKGEISGQIVDVPRGNGGFGFDRVFAPDGFNGKTAAELDEVEYDKFYTTIKPFTAVREFLINETTS